MPAPKNNTNAQRGESPADAHLQVRINAQLKEQARKSAQKQGLSLSEWVNQCIRKSL